MLSVEKCFFNNRDEARRLPSDVIREILEIDLLSINTTRLVRSNVDYGRWLITY